MVKAYTSEPGSDELNQALEGRGDILVSELAITEVISALSRLLRQGTVEHERVRRVQNDIVRRLDEGIYGRVELTRDVHRRAEHFLLNLTATPLRASDALHLALATSAQAMSMASFDASLRAAARAVGLAIYPPEEPQ